jgi:2,4-dienoyl-CoA reductase-like NADH-dependent reductase (Old Yellow Enzyme family)
LKQSITAGGSTGYDEGMNNLFDTVRVKEVQFRNRIFVSPMCEYSAVDGVPNEWHLVHLGSRAVGGAALVMTEATGVEAIGRISLGDTGMYNDEQQKAWAKIVDFIKSQGAVAGMQIAHAGRKASTNLPWQNKGKPLTAAEGAWPVVGPSAIAFDEGYPVPRELTREEIKNLVSLFQASAKRALAAGFEVVEIHAAHGYLINEFFSPLTNTRTDEYGGGFENRIRFLVEIVHAVKKVWPDRLPLFVRISASDWHADSWGIEESVKLAQVLKHAGVDVVDCSSGGVFPHVKIPTGPGYQVPFADAIRAQANILTAAVGEITQPEQAQEIIANQKADFVVLAREMLRDPYWPRRAAKALGKEIQTPKQYSRSW